jgi:hypothetical protein
MPYRDYMRALIVAEAEAAAPNQREVVDSIKQERIN